jgi:hypothetical protein
MTNDCTFLATKKNASNWMNSFIQNSHIRISVPMQNMFPFEVTKET